jgi:hypothetical protein
MSPRAPQYPHRKELRPSWHESTAMGRHGFRECISNHHVVVGGGTGSYVETKLVWAMWEA